MPLSEEQIANMKLKRQKILDSATALFATQGYEGTTIKKVAQAADVSFGSVFTYFKDKEELLYTVVVEPLDDLAHRLFQFDPQANDPLVEIEKMVHQHVQVFSKLNHYLNLVAQIINQFRKYPSAFARLDRFHDELREKVAELIRNGQQKGILSNQQDSLSIATLYTSLLIGLRLNTTDYFSDDIWDTYAKAIIQLFGPIKQG